MNIKINKNLDFFSDFDPTKDSKSVSIGILCKDIESGKMTLPIFQTYIRWTTEKSVALLNFQLNGMAPVAPISINIIDNLDLATIQVSFIDRVLTSKETIKSKFSVIDGQQRLSCNYKAYINHEDFKCIVLDITNGIFLVNTGQVKKNQIPVGILYNHDVSVFAKYLEQHKDLQEFKIQNLLTKVRNKFFGYYYTVNFAHDLIEEDQLEWFEVLNLAGSRIPNNQVFLTDMLVRGIDFYKEFSDKFFEYLSESNFSSLFVRKATEISIPLASLNAAYEVVNNKKHTSNFSPIPSDAKGVFMSKLDANILRTMFTSVLENLEKAVNFIFDNHLNTPTRIDYITYLTGFFIFLENKEITQIQKQHLINWYNSVEFSSQGNTTRREFFEELVNLAKNIS